MFASNTSQVSQDAVFVEDVFSTYLYTGNGSSQTITNGIDLAGKGGLVWVKNRSAADNNFLVSSNSTNSYLFSNATNAAGGGGFTFNSNGYFDPGEQQINGNNYVSWTFRKQPKFFDVVTYTGDGVAGRTVAHNLGSVPGSIFVKRTDTSAAWAVYHRSLANTEYLVLNTTAAKATGATYWNSTTPTSTVFSLGTNASVNASGGTYVAYLFAHDAGGFGLTGADNVISCGSFTTDGSGNADVTLGWEPQWLLVKPYSAAGYGWSLADNMRGMSVASPTMRLQPNTSGAEASMGAPAFIPTATGFQVRSFAESNIYIAIRRGPMKTPTSGTSVFFPKVIGGQGVTQNITGFGFPVDLAMTKQTSGTQTWAWTDRLRGATKELTSANTTAETTYADDITSFALMDGFIVGSGASGNVNTDGTIYDHCGFRRAPGFFDVVCYTKDSSQNQRVAHGLQVAPELIISKMRNAGDAWYVYSQARGRSKYLTLNSTNAENTYANAWGSSDPTATDFGVNSDLIASGYNNVAYLFASCPGVSKVGSYTGTGTTLQINCGFTAGARFVLIRRVSAGGGDWYVWDSARGIVAGNDPYLLLNDVAAEVTNTDYVDTYSAGFEISSTAPAAINANGGTFVFLAIS